MSVGIVRVLFALCLSAALTGCATLPRDIPRPVSQAWSQPAESPLSRAFAGQLAGHRGASGFYLLSSGTDALSVRAALADNARHTLDLQYYMVRDDATTRMLLDRVLQAAGRGVRVRLLVDDLFAVGKDFDLATFAAHSNVEVRVFNPFLHRGAMGLSHLFEFLGDSVRLNRRMHNKLWIADNSAAIIGGRNLGDEYFDAQENVNFSDLDVFGIGPIAQQVSASFDEYWNSQWAVPVEAFLAASPGPEQLAAFDRALRSGLDAFDGTDYARDLREDGIGARIATGQLALTVAPATALYDPPAKLPAGAQGEGGADHALVAKVRPLFENAAREVLLISPYFIPTQQGVDLFARLSRRGVRVRVLTNSLASTDVPVVHAGYARWRAALLSAGVELHEARPEPHALQRPRRSGASSGASLHTKAIVIDGRYVVIGSMNLDPRSRLLNTEVAVLLESPDFGAEVTELFEQAVQPAHAFRVARAGGGTDPAAIEWVTEEGGQQVRYADEPLAGFWRRLYAAVAAAFAPDSFL